MSTKIKLITFVLLTSAILIAGCGKKNEVKNTGNNNSKNESLAPVSQNNTNTNQSSGNKNGVKPIHLTAATFKEKVFNYDKNKDWKYEGDKPCIVDFYADWCKPCKMVAPILEELSSEYEGKIIIYKVNTDEEQELAGVFGIQSIPSLLFVPSSGQPKMMTGAMPKDSFVKNINEYLIKN
jgi:thioredoxin